MGRSWDGKCFFCGNQYHNGGGCLRNSFLSQASAWYLFPHLFDHFTPRKTYCFFAPGFVIFTFPEDAANISMKLWEFGSRTACCVHKGTVSLWHQQNQNCKVSILEPALMAIKIVFFKSFIYWSTKASRVGTCFPWLTAKAGLEDCGGQVLRHGCAETLGGSAFGAPGHSHEWWSLGNPRGQSILLLSHQETHFAGAVVLPPHVKRASLAVFCTNRSCCLTLDLPPINAPTSCPEGEKFQTLPSINIKNMSHRDKATQQLPCVSIPTESFQQAAQIHCSHTQLR